MREELMKLRVALEEMRKSSLFKKPLVAEKAPLAAVVLIEQMVDEIERLKSEKQSPNADKQAPVRSIGAGPISGAAGGQPPVL